MIHPDLRETESEWRARVDGLIAQGWGDVDQPEIPANWQSVRGPDRSFNEESKAQVVAGLKRLWKQRHRAPRGSLKRLRLEETAATMRAKAALQLKGKKRAAILVRWKGSTDSRITLETNDRIISGPR